MSSDDDIDIDLEEPFIHHEFVDVMEDEDNSENLYPAADITVIKTLALLFTWFSSFPGISKEAFSRLLFVLHTFLLPVPNQLPASYQQAYSLINKWLVPVQQYDCCVNDCILFRSCKSGNYQSMSTCPVCGEHRYMKYTETARKRFKYIPLAPRFGRLFKNKKMSQLIQSHSNIPENNIVTNLHQTRWWKKNYSEEGLFRGDPRGLSLGLCLDGMNPFAKDKASYSMWPINLCLLNLPHRVRITAGSMLLAGIIPGRNEPKNLDPYIQLLVDELVTLNGLNAYDNFRGETFSLQASIALNVLDYPGQNKVFHCQGEFLLFLSCFM